jgi:uncharacterized Rmd1/YagE family protein
VPKWCGNGNSNGSGGSDADGGKREGEVFLFRNGSFVCWGLTEEDAVRFRREVLMPANAEVGTLAEPETEELEFATDPSECVVQHSLLLSFQKINSQSLSLFFCLCYLKERRDYRET